MRIHRLSCLIVALLLGCKDAATGPITDTLQPEATRVIGLAKSDESTCALTADGRRHCWGTNRRGEFGNGTSTPSEFPIAIDDGIRFTTIVGSFDYWRMCGLAADGTGYCWGYGGAGEIGDGTTNNRNRPTRIDATFGFRALATSDHSCGIAANGTAYCWGSAIGGQLGTGAGLQENRPARVVSSALYTAVTTGNQFSCALTQGGDAHCWGWGMGMGSGPADRSVDAARPVSGGLKFQSISAGDEHVCAVTTDRRLYCWGMLGRFYPEGFRAAPTQIATSARLVSVTSGGRMAAPAPSCGLDDQGAAWCWNSLLRPMRVGGRHRFIGLVGGRDEFCGYTVGGRALCWTWFPEHSPDGTRYRLNEPFPISALSD